MFYMLPEPGHHNPSFPLARALAARGHEVVYGATLDFEGEVLRRGFRFASFHRDAHPRGWAARCESLGPARSEHARRVATAYRRENFLSGRVEASVREINPDVLVVDVITYPMALVAHHLGIPCLRVCTSLSQRLDELPPLTSCLPPDTPRLLLEEARQRAHILNFLPEGGATGDLYCARFGYPSEQASYSTVFCLDLKRYPEALLCASAFDFPRASAEPPTYLACPVELERSEQVSAALRDFVAPSTRLVYVSLGTQSERFPHRASLFETLWEAFRARPDWRAVVASGRSAPGLALEGTPPNVMSIEHAPQLWLLERAAAFVTHAGLGSVREAIALRVPMLAVPQLNDGFGNAARIAYHGLGMHLPTQAVTGSSLGKCLDRLLEDGNDFRACLARLDRATRQEEAAQRGPALVEALAGQRRARPVVPHTTSPGLELGTGLAWLFIGGEAQLPDGTRLAPGALLESSREASPELRGAGFYACPELGDALERAEGSVLARVELRDGVLADEPYLVGRGLRCAWLAEVEPALAEYACWCAERALETELADAPAVGDWCKQILLECGAAKTIGAKRGTQAACWRELTAPVLAVSAAAGRILGDALAPASADAARLSRWRAIRLMARRAVADGAGTAAGGEAYLAEYWAARRRLDSELRRLLRTFAPAIATDL